MHIVFAPDRPPTEPTGRSQKPRSARSLLVVTITALLLLTAWSYPPNHATQESQNSFGDHHRSTNRYPNQSNCRWYRICERSVEVSDTTVSYVETGKIKRARCHRPRRSQCARSDRYTKGKTLLFLHGRAFTKQDWIDSGILRKAARAGNKAIAIDLPGYGDTPATTSENGQFLADTIQALGLSPESVVLVSPSLSGFHSLAMLELDPPPTLAGYVAISPKGVPTFAGLTPETTIPTLIMWADNDPAIPTSQAELLASKIPDSQIKLFESNTHPFYFDLTTEFNRELALFVRSLNHKPQTANAVST